MNVGVIFKARRGRRETRARRRRRSGEKVKLCVLFYFRRTGDEPALIINKSQVTNLCDDYMKYKTVFILSLSESFPPFTPFSSDGLPWHGHLNHGQIRPGGGPRPHRVSVPRASTNQDRAEEGPKSPRKDRSLSFPGHWRDFLGCFWCSSHSCSCTYPS